MLLPSGHGAGETLPRRIEGHVEALRALAELGCPLAEEADDGCTPADLAIQVKHWKAVRALVKELGCPKPSLSSDAGIGAAAAGPEQRLVAPPGAVVRGELLGWGPALRACFWIDGSEVAARTRQGDVLPGLTRLTLLPN